VLFYCAIKLEQYEIQTDEKKAEIVNHNIRCAIGIHQMSPGNFPLPTFLMLVFQKVAKMAVEFVFGSSLGFALSFWAGVAVSLAEPRQH